MKDLDIAFKLDRGGFKLDVAFKAPGVGVTALFGRSGCGKTTVLRCVAGLERAAGHCRLDGDAWQDDSRGIFLKTHRRPIGYVFQEASLFSHLSVRRNLEYGLKRISAEQRQVGFDEVVDLLGIRKHLDRDPAGLSGGERQRVSIARALLTSPSLLLMDEPLSALDHTSKQDILPYLERLHDNLQIPVLYVSHSPDEVARLADRIIMLQDGHIQASGSATEILSRLDLPLAQDAEASSIIDGRVLSHDDDYRLSRLEIPGGSLTVARLERAVGELARVRIHARDVSIALDEPGTSSILNILPARILEIREIEHAQVLVKLCTGSGEQTPLLARVTRHSRDRLNLGVGQEVYAQVKAVALMD
ncbi:molybdenum ABC transporter ATP-binding protein [Thiorhodococcus mannitoliphagus]|uniref:Molybdenum ABC transporter ATP-binding protein n=1 Tax=Thiorhodococcus mannitoliphagus TaxID=329406 RepID=A0A6P1DV49_9GAMM|nr:molybdenum ABC transporter ATP-binding protein [Thiorhodococcus mannitoliphagus]NEX21083.1 molybdenum ABC transporter ATP-binding protein [Thiorhodococcus mannitoliphagus]